MLTLLCAYCCVGQAAAYKAMSPEEVIARIQAQVDAYCDVEFEYEVHARFWPSPRLITSPDGQDVVDIEPVEGEPTVVHSKDVFQAAQVRPARHAEGVALLVSFNSGLVQTLGAGTVGGLPGN